LSAAIFINDPYWLIMFDSILLCLRHRLAPSFFPERRRPRQAAQQSRLRQRESAAGPRHADGGLEPDDHNLFDGVSQRAPRVHYGNVDVANNLYWDSSSQTNRFQYNLGVGVHSDITSQNNAFETQGVATSSLVKRFGDSGHLSDSGSLVNGKAVDLSSSPSGKGPGGGAIAHLDATADVAAIVLAQPRAGKLEVGA
jgi:hypothetical protein